MTTRLALSGDSILNRRFSDWSGAPFEAVLRLFKDADLAYTHLETVVHDYTDPGLYPAAEAGYTWMRSPVGVIADLASIGVRLVSLASNHALDYSYAGLESTQRALDHHQIAHAGTGNNLTEARTRAIVNVGHTRVALVSMTSTFAPWTRAADNRGRVQGRPGVNAVRYRHIIERARFEDLVRLAATLGTWVTQVGNETWLVHPAGLHNSTTEFRVADEAEHTSEVLEVDMEANLSEIRAARDDADCVIVQLHNHEWHPQLGLGYPPDFVRTFARNCIDAGADIFLAQGSHAPLRGIELHRGRPIFYDPGSLFDMSSSVVAFPNDFYDRHAHIIKTPPASATLVDVWRARTRPSPWKTRVPSPLPVGSFGVVPICNFDHGAVTSIELHPFMSNQGFPEKVTGSRATEVFDRVRELSAPFNTRFQRSGDLLYVGLPAPANKIR